MTFGIRAAFDAVREVDFGDINATYDPFGSATSSLTRIANFKNSTNEDIYISLDGTVDHIRLAANSVDTYDFTSNEVTTDGLFLEKGTQFYVRYESGAPTSGAVWVQIIYGAGGTS